MTSTKMVGGTNPRQARLLSLHSVRSQDFQPQVKTPIDQVSLSSRPVFLSLGKQLARLPLDGSPLELGRGDRSPLKFQSPGVSRKHALLRAKEGQLEVMDIGSTNGTFVDQKRIKSNEWTSLSGEQRLTLAGEPVNWKCS